MQPRDEGKTSDQPVKLPPSRLPEHEKVVDGNGHFDPARMAPLPAQGHAIGAWRPRPGGSREFSLADIGPAIQQAARIVGRYWWVGLILAVLELTAFLLFMSDRKEMVTAEATLVAESSLDQVLRDDRPTEGDRDERENVMRNHHAVMTSRRFRARLAENLSQEEARAVQLPLLAASQEPSNANLRAALAGAIEVDRERGRDLFTVRASHPDEATAVMLVDRFIDVYLDLARGELRGANDRARSALQEAASDMNRQVHELEVQRQEFQQRFDAITGGGGREVIADRIRNLNNAMSLVRVQRAQAEVEYRQAQADLEASPTPFNNPMLAAYGNTAELRADIDQRQAERAMLAAHYGPNHPKLIEADRALESQREALRKNFSVALNELEAKVAIAQSQEEELRAGLNELLRQSGEVDRVEAELATLDQKIAARRSAHGDLLARVARAGISADLPADVMRVVDHAYVRHPLVPARVALGVVGVGGAVFAFIAGPLLWHACRRRVTSTLNLEAMLGTELLGVVPRLSWMLASQRPHIVRRGRRPAAVESFLSTASQFELRSPSGCPKRIVVSSTLPGEGKSVVASNLAASFTRLGYRALLVDADFRRPSQQRFHRVPNDLGLLDWIERGCIGGGEASLEDIGLHALPGGTWLLPTGGSDPEPARHLMRPEVRALFDRLAREFDVIVIDTSPAGLFPDAFFVTRFADAAALVVREGIPGTDQVRKVIADFSRTSTPVSGIIFNAISGGAAHPSFGYRSVASRYARHYSAPSRQLPTRVHGVGPYVGEPISS